MKLAYKEQASKLESAAKRFAISGAIGLCALGGAERDAKAQARGMYEPVHELMPIHVLGYGREQSLESGPGSFRFNSNAARTFKTEAWMGLAFGQKSRSSLSIGPSYELFSGYGSYVTNQGIQLPKYQYAGHALGAGAIARFKFSDEYSSPELTAYGSAAYRVYEAVLDGTRGANGDDASLQRTRLGLSQCGFELGLPSTSRFSVRRLGAGIVSDPRNAFLFMGMNLALLRSSGFTLRSSLSPNVSLMHGKAGAGADIRPFELEFRSGHYPQKMSYISVAPGVKYSYGAEGHMFAAYGNATYSLQRPNALSLDISAQAGYLAGAGSSMPVPDSMFGALSLGTVF